MTENAHRVSAVIPVFNGERFLAEAIESVFVQGLPVEMIVIDDGSTDGSSEIARGFGESVRYFRQENQGVARARNAGIAKASGEFIGFLDQDDVWPEGSLQALVDALDGAPEADMASGRVKVFGGKVPGRPWTLSDEHEVNQTLLLGSRLMRRSIFDKIGMLSESVGTADDADLVMRTRDLGVKAVHIERVTLLYRWHGANTGSDIDKLSAFGIDALKASLDRRRGKTPPGRG